MAKANLENFLVKSNHEFAKELYQILSSRAGAEQEHLFFSPLSIQIALISVYIGADGTTAEEMRQFLHLHKNRAVLLDNIDRLMNTLQNPKLHIATGMFIGDKFKLLPEYQELITKYINCDCKNVNFEESKRETVDLINKWVCSQTNNTIKNIIDEEYMKDLGNAETVTLLINAIYFKNDWEKEFITCCTDKQKFYTTETQFRTINMMNLISYFRYSKNNKFKVLVLPYKDRNFSMVVLLPNKITGLFELEKSLTDLNLSNVIKKTNYVEVAVTFPTFKLEQKLNLIDALKSLGMKSMFDEGNANFKKMAYFHPPENVFVSDVFHKSFIDVNEKGTCASATTVAGKVLGRIITIEEVYNSQADHPFIFLINHGENIVFMGKFS